MQVLIVESERGGTMEKKNIGGTEFLTVSVRRGVAWRAKLSARRAARALERLGVRAAVFPREYAFGTVFAARGICPVDTVSLQKKTAAAIARFALKQSSFRRLVLAGETCDTAVYEAALSLRREVRQFGLSFARGEEALARRFCFEWGIAAETELSPTGCTQEDLVLLFSPREEWEGARGAVVPLFDAALAPEYIWPREIAPMGLEPLQFLSALCAAGELCAESLCVKGLGGGERKNYRSK